MRQLQKKIRILIGVLFIATGSLHANDLFSLPEVVISPTTNIEIVPRKTNNEIVPRSNAQQSFLSNNYRRATKFAQASTPKNGYFIEKEFVNWKIRRGDLDYAISGVLNAGGGLDNAIRHEVEHSSEAGFRMLFGKGISDDWNLAFGLTSYHAAESDTIIAGATLVYATLTNMCLKLTHSR